MCGILSIYSPFTNVNQAALNKGIEALYHRGPDNRSTWLSPNQKVGLAHARLSIIDFTTGNQPILSEDNSIAIVVNGEFYDFEQIRKDLQEQGAVFKTGSDSEIALHLYQRYGLAGLQKLRGEFSFVIWDENTQQLIAVRDRCGINPLFYCFENGVLHIASEIKAIFAAGVPAKWDMDAYANRAFLYRDRTLFQGIAHVPPGHCLIASGSSYRLQKYWDFDYPAANQTLDISDDEAIQLVREKLLEATKTRLRADVPVGVYLSGGIDSCAILGMVSEIKQEPVDAFTLSFEEDDYDEGKIAAQMAKHAGSRHHIIPITQTEIADNFIDSVRYSETICMNAHGTAKYLLSKAVNKLGYRVVLTGEGADEVFAGYPSFRQDKLLSDNLNSADLSAAQQALKEKNKVLSGVQFSNDAITSEQINNYFGHIPSWLPPLTKIHENLLAFGKPALLKTNQEAAIAQYINYLDYQQIQDKTPLAKALYSISKCILPNYILTNLGDRMEMAHHLEGRVPFLDHQLIELVTQLPDHLKIRGQSEKYVLREAVKPYLIEQVYTRQKHAFLAPPSVVQPEQKFSQLVQDMLRSDLLDAMPFFDKRKVEIFLDGVKDTPKEKWPSTEAILMEMLGLCLSLIHI